VVVKLLLFIIIFLGEIRGCFVVEDKFVKISRVLKTDFAKQKFINSHKNEKNKD
jgi:hypothetical protein